MEVRMDLEGQSCFGPGVTCRGNFHFLVVLVLGDILVKCHVPWERGCTACLHLWLEFGVLKSPISLPSISGKVREEWPCVIKGFQLDLLAVSSVLCHVVLYYLFPPFTVMLQVQSLLSFLAAAPKACGSSWAQLVVQRKHVGRCRWLCLCCEYLFENPWKEIFCLTHWDRLCKVQVIFTLLFSPHPHSFDFCSGVSSSPVSAECGSGHTNRY